MMRALPSKAASDAKSTCNGRSPGCGWLRRAGSQSFQRLVLFSGIALLLTCCPLNGRGKAIPSESAKAGAQPEAKIPVTALGYMAPGELPQFDYEAMVELHFIDATHLLFSFNIGGLMQRDHTCPTAETQRKVRAVVLNIPSGKVQKQAEWKLYDGKDYLWGLGNGQFLLRRCSRLELVGASLDPQPLIDAAGKIEWIGFSPDYLVMDMEEESEPSGKVRPPTKNPVFGPHGPQPGKMDVSFIRLHPLQIISRGRLMHPGVVPILGDGIIEALAGPKNSWTIDLQPFRGAERKLATVQSACMPRITPISSSVIVAAVCSSSGKWSFEGYDTTGLQLWKIPVDSDVQEPRFLLTRNGAHFALQWLHSNRPVAALDPLNNTVIDGEVIDIYDTTTGVLIGTLRTTPVYTAGRNADFSPDGTRIAVLHDGVIEIYSVNGLGKAK